MKTSLLLSKTLRASLVVALASLLGASAADAATRTWKTATTGDWFNINNWEENSYPGAGDDAVITAAGASVLLTNATDYLKSLTLSGTLTFSNWNTTLSATNVTIQSGGQMTLPGPFTGSEMSNKVHVICTNLTVEVGGSIYADGKGYAGAIDPPGPTLGSGFGAGKAGGGGGYGGRGSLSTVADDAVGKPYGVPETPLEPGSGGGSQGGSQAGGAGGGLIRVEASGGAVQLNGPVSANGGGGMVWAGGGSGGGIYIQCKTITGGGSLSANGGPGGRNGGYGGGGGRIAVVYDPAAQAATNNPTGVFSAAAGAAGSDTAGVPLLLAPDIGTLYFSDTRFLGATVRHSGQWLSPGLTNWNVSSLSMTNSWLRFPQAGFRLTVTNDVVLAGSSRLDIGANAYRSGVGMSYLSYNTGTEASVFSVGGSVSLATGCTMCVFSSQTNATTASYGFLMSVTGNVTIASNAWIYPISHIINGGTPLLRMSNLLVTAGGGMNADGQGYSGGIGGNGVGWGPGAQTYSGGGYGGVGGTGYSGETGGSTYGSSNAPIQAGSGGGGGPGNGSGGTAGGSIRIEASDAVQLGGLISANGWNNYGWGNGGSGGGIFIQCKTLSGSGSLSANGGYSAATGGGGGGRLAVWYGTISDDDRTKILNGQTTNLSGTFVSASTLDSFAGTKTVTGGGHGGSFGGSGAAGTVVFLTVLPAPAGMVIYVR